MNSNRNADTAATPADRFAERLARGLARQTSRRGLLTRLGAALVAAPAFPLLPVNRADAADQPAPPKAGSKKAPAELTEFEKKSQSKDPSKCNYWRHCAIDGTPCGGCGGGVHTCPPGATPALTSWIGTCRNPDDARYYLVAYRDCCGKDLCGGAQEGLCFTNDRELPVYRPQSNNDTLWCFGSSAMTYHCTTSALIGLASE